VCVGDVVVGKLCSGLYTVDCVCNHGVADVEWRGEERSQEDPGLCLLLRSGSACARSELGVTDIAGFFE